MSKLSKVFVTMLLVLSLMVLGSGVAQADVIDDMIKAGYMKIELSKDNVQISIEKQVYNSLTYQVKMNVCSHCCTKYNRPSAGMFILGTEKLVVIYNPAIGMFQVND